MKITLVSHASVLIEGGGKCLWTDPWLTGKAFNDSWSLNPPPVWSNDKYDAIDLLWISHEHPDHFSVPTLRALPTPFKERVVVLSQAGAAGKIFAAMSSWGFRHFQCLPNQTWIRLGSMELYSYQVGLIDSTVVTRADGQTIVNVNDCDLSEKDLLALAGVAAGADAVLNQFSIAGSDITDDYEQLLKRVARRKLTNMITVHRALAAKTTVPFASFAYFSAEDNKFVNAFANSLVDVDREFSEAGLALTVLVPGEGWPVGEPTDLRRNLAQVALMRMPDDALTYTAPALKPEPALREAFGDFVNQLRQNFPTLVLRWLLPIVVHVRDHGRCYVLDFNRGEMKQVAILPSSADIAVFSQPLWFAFRFPFGLETLAVSCRLKIQHNFRRWRRLKIISILWNNGVNLKPSKMRTETIRYLASRVRHGLIEQYAYKRRQRNELRKGVI